jgi:hypothetical protein
VWKLLLLVTLVAGIAPAGHVGAWLALVALVTAVLGVMLVAYDAGITFRGLFQSIGERLAALEERDSTRRG